MPLDPHLRRLLLRCARQAVAAAVGRGDPPDVGAYADEGLDAPWGAFVTLRNGGQLRGCRGLLDGEGSLAATVAKVARQSALEDPRFPPVCADELDDLELEISLLRDRRPVTDPAEIVLGRDGLLLSQGWRRGFLLPQVAVDNGYDVPTFLDKLCMKAGLPAGAWRWSDAHLEAFEVEHFA